MMFIVRASRDPEVDLYALWSTGTDSPDLIGTREAVKQWWIEQYGRAGNVEQTLRRTDEQGTSLLTGPNPLPGSWECPDLLVMWPMPGRLPRNLLPDYLRAAEKDDEAGAAAQVVPWPVESESDHKGS